MARFIRYNWCIFELTHPPVFKAGEINLSY